MFNFINNFITLIRYFLTLCFYGAVFPLRKIPFIGFIFWPFELFTFFRIKQTKGERLLKALIALGPTFIKLGQTLATRPDIIGDNLAKTLSTLQDSLPAFSSTRAKLIFEKELGDLTKFQDFAPKPIAAASIAQVHRATLLDGTQVAVKILRPNVRKRFQRDLSLLLFIAKLVDRFEKFKRIRLPDIMQHFKDITDKELDLRFEAANASKLKENLKSDSNIIVPAIYWDLTSKNILTSEWVDGIKIDQIDKLKQVNLDLKKIANNLVLCYFNQAYRDGFFHGDMHPGNILITRDAKIAFIDFGIMGQIAIDDKVYVTRIIDGFIKRDYDYIAKMHYDAGYVPRTTNIQEFSLACRSIGEPIFGRSVSELSIAKMLAQLFQITEKFGMKTQPQLLLLQKTLLIIEGVGGKLDPDLNIWEVGEPWMKGWAKDNLGIKACAKRSGDEILTLLAKAPTLIKNLEDLIANKANNTKNKSKDDWPLIMLTIIVTALLTQFLSQ